MKRIVYKKNIIEFVFNKFNSLVDQKLIKDVVDITNSYIAEELLKNNCISIENFGTFSPYYCPGYNAVLIVNKHLDKKIAKKVPGYKNIKFNSHFRFIELINIYKEFLKKKNNI